MMPLLIARDLTVQYGPLPVLSGLNLELLPGQVTVVLGENGAGKSTLLRTLALELPMMSGHLTLGGVDAATNPERAAQMLIHVAQHPPLAGSLTANEHLQAMADLRSLEAGQLKSRVEEVATALRIDAVLDRPVRALSGGTAHKVALLLALVSEARLVILDEPHSGLDVRSSLALRELIRAKRDRGTTFLLASHLAEATLAIADRALVLARGAPGTGARWALDLDEAQLQGFGGNARALEEAVLAAMG